MYRLRSLSQGCRNFGWLFHIGFDDRAEANLAMDENLAFHSSYL